MENENENENEIQNKNSLIGWVVYEEIAIGIINPSTTPDHRSDQDLESNESEI